MATSVSANSWLRAQRKTELTELAENIGMKNYENMKKSELEIAMDDYISKDISHHTKNSQLSGYFNSRSRQQGSPVKKDPRSSIKEEPTPGLRSTNKRKSISKSAEELASSSDEGRATTTAVMQTPARQLTRAASHMSRTPAQLVSAVDRSTAAMRKRMHSLYEESGITEASHATRDSLSTVRSIIFCVSVVELYFIRQEILANRYAFTIPAIGAFGTSDYPVYLPDLFLLLTSSFWSPALTWFLTSLVIPCFFGYFFNLTAASGSSGPRSRTRSSAPETVVDPLTFSIIKALISYIVYAKGATMCGLLSEISIVRLNGAVYGGYRGILVGTAIIALGSIYEAILRK